MDKQELKSKLKSALTIDQGIKILYASLVITVLMLGFEILFDIDAVNDTISGWISSTPSSLIYLVFWIAQFIQVCIVPIPGMLIIQVAISLNILGNSAGFIPMLGSPDFWIFFLISITAYMAGAICAYFIGYKWGRKAVKWCAGDDESYEKWARFFNQTKSKRIYFLTVLLPVFPDDVICLVCGSVKFSFRYFCMSNMIGRSVGLLTMMMALGLLDNLGNGSIPWGAIGWNLVLILEMIGLIILYTIKRNNIRKQLNSKK